MSTAAQQPPTYGEQVARHSEQPVFACYQCGTCTSVCPVAAAMDYTPRAMVHLVREGLAERAETAAALALCTGCSACGAACPKGIDAGLVMDTVRELGRAAGRGPADRRSQAFYTSFLNSVAAHGRVFEAGFMARFNLVTGRPWAGAGIALGLLRRGKLRLWPGRVRGRADVRRIFARLGGGRQS